MDLISRQDAIDAFRKSLCALEIESGREYGISFRGVERILKSLPSAQSKRMRGRWVKDEEASSQHIESIYVCSACNNMEAWGEVEKNTFKFCPNCGADMRGE